MPFDTTVPHSARVDNYWLGGKDHFAADRAVADQVIAGYPAVVDSARAQRAFLGQAVRYLAAEAGIRQFLDIGTGLPSPGNAHEVAQREAPDARVVCVDNDPIVLSHARALLVSTPQGRTAIIDADLRDPLKILAEADGVIDFSEPVAIILLGILHFLSDRDDPFGIVAQLVDGVSSGSHLAISHIANDVDEQATKTMAAYNKGPGEPITPRTHAEVSKFFAGLEPVPPGLVQVHRWEPWPRALRHDRDLPNYGGLARKP